MKIKKRIPCQKKAVSVKVKKELIEQKQHLFDMVPWFVIGCLLLLLFLFCQKRRCQIYCHQV